MKDGPWRGEWFLAWRVGRLSASFLTLTGAAADEDWRLHGGTQTD